MQEWIIPAAAATVGALVTWAIASLRGRRKQIIFWYEQTELVPAGRNELAVAYESELVEEPYLILARFRNLGPGDISVSDFEGGGLGLTVSGAKIIAALDPGERSIEVRQRSGNVPLVAVAPWLFMARTTNEVRLLVNGEPTSVAAEVAIRSARLVGRASRDRRLLVAAVSLGLLSIGMLVAMFAVYWPAATPPLELGSEARLLVVGSLLSWLAGVAVAGLTVFRDLRS